jgi:hypothetical protein
MSDPMARYYRLLNRVGEELCDAVVEQRPPRLLADLVDQIERNDFKDSHGHEAKMLKAFLDARAAVTTEHPSALCDDCDEFTATETWDYSDAPIPNPPAPDRLCSSCADKRRDRAAERAAEESA